MAERFKKYFNSTTINGRANVAKATYATIFLGFIYFRMRRRSSKKEALNKDLNQNPDPHNPNDCEPDCSCDEFVHEEPVPEPELPPESECRLCR